jgi:hypothetical protein
LGIADACVRNFPERTLPGKRAGDDYLRFWGWQTTHNNYIGLDAENAAAGWWEVYGRVRMRIHSQVKEPLLPYVLV